MFVVDTAVFVVLVLSCALVAAGLKSRTVALSLALVNLGFVCYQHPFFRYVWIEGGEWKYDAVLEITGTVARRKSIREKDQADDDDMALEVAVLGSPHISISMACL